MDRRETERILEVIREVRAADTRAAIATVVRVKGSAYRREGARIIVREDGTHECLLSGGCLEPAVAAAAAKVIATGDPVIASYDLEEDSLLGLGIGCSGAVDIRIERVENDPVSRAWFQILEGAQAAVLVTPLAGATGRLLILPNGDVVGELSAVDLMPRIVARAQARMSAPFPASGAERIGDTELFFELSETPPPLVIFGAGPDAGPLAQLAAEVGFAVTVVDVREAFLTAERFPRAMRVCAHFSEFPQRLRLDRRTFVVVMNHHLERDQESLRFALSSDVPYIGLLGPRSRFQKLLSGLRREGFALNEATLTRVRSPIGLSLGAESAEEIAVSIVGELLAFRRGFDGGFLNGRESSLHRPDEIRSTAR